MESIGDARGFSGKTPITPSRDFSVETLTGVTPSWKTELNRSISVMEDGIPGVLQERWLPWKVDLYSLKVVSPWGRCFRTGGLIYDSIPPLGLSLRSPIKLIQSPIRVIREFRDGT